MIADAVADTARTALWNAIPATTAEDRLAHMRAYHRLEWQPELTTAARWARHLGATWQHIGAAIGIDADTARHQFATPATWRGSPFLAQDPDWVTGDTGDTSRQ